MMDFSKLSDIEIQQIREDPNNQDWFILSHKRILSEDFIREFQDKVFWNVISHYQKLSEHFIIEYQDKINSNCLSGNDNISDEIKEFCKIFL